MNGKITTLNRFISRCADKCLPFFKLLWKNTLIFWNKECENAFQYIKAYLSRASILISPFSVELLYLYPIIIARTISAILHMEREMIQQPMYYIS